MKRLEMLSLEMLLTEKTPSNINQVLLLPDSGPVQSSQIRGVLPVLTLNKLFFFSFAAFAA